MVPLFENNDRMNRAIEQFSVLRGDKGQKVDMVRADHDRKRLLDPAEPVLERACRLPDAGEVETANPPYGKDEPGIEQPRCLFYRVGTTDHVPELVIQGKFRPAAGARDRLGMVAP